MAVKIRLKRAGAKNAPVFRIVVADSRSPRDGRFIEELGTYQPLKKGDNVKMDLERAKYWLSKGAQPSDTVASFIRRANRAAAGA
ncbi:MAG TPA: 30S ribosomal protein S16 [Verrucomicrobiota bacterium]|jgi:small subunit ribosomal protein S16|nr:30S ribosomal protein S16 [Verrucomicrobiota bacterium]HRT09888.1 30S ribosomal protein S16 [Candidatus Paceibacterota bacterium]HRT58338.1 30S ribosomal protein S16 [Candidatus Paceibacterota bacterium]